MSFILPLLNGVAARLLGYKRMWLYPGYLYMFTILITPICALTLSSPSWVCVTFSDLRSGSMVCHLFDLCCLLCRSYSSIHCYYRHYLQCFVSRFPWESEWYWPGVCFTRSFYRKEGVRM